MREHCSNRSRVNAFVRRPCRASGSSDRTMDSARDQNVKDRNASSTRQLSEVQALSWWNRREISTQQYHMYRVALSHINNLQQPEIGDNIARPHPVVYLHRYIHTAQRHTRRRCWRFASVLTCPPSLGILSDAVYQAFRPYAATGR